jgi:hypothetical protein
MVKDEAVRCRRCGSPVTLDAEPFSHVLVLRTDHGPHEVRLLMCRPCGTGFSTLRDRDEYVRLAYFG